MPRKRKLDIELWVNKYSDYLYRYALIRVGNEDLAKDMVQETFLTGMKNYESFKKKSKEITWLVGILRNKLSSYYKSNEKQRTLSQESFVDNEGRNYFEELFDLSDFWNTNVNDWETNPEEHTKNLEFKKKLMGALEDIGTREKAIFILKEIENYKNKEICKEFNISKTNMWVILHRTREKLRVVLANWYETKSQKKRIKK